MQVVLCWIIRYRFSIVFLRVALAFEYNFGSRVSSTENVKLVICFTMFTSSFFGEVREENCQGYSKGRDMGPVKEFCIPILLKRMINCVQYRSNSHFHLWRSSLRFPCEGRKCHDWSNLYHCKSFFIISSRTENCNIWLSVVMAKIQWMVMQGNRTSLGRGQTLFGRNDYVTCFSSDKLVEVTVIVGPGCYFSHSLCNRQLHSIRSGSAWCREWFPLCWFPLPGCDVKWAWSRTWKILSVFSLQSNWATLRTRTNGLRLELNYELTQQQPRAFEKAIA